MKLSCKSCSADIPPSDINIQAAIAKCSRCGAVFGFADDIPGGASSAAKKRGPVSLPKAFQLDNRSGDLSIARRWFSPVAFFMVFFCLFWDGFLLVWYTIAFTAGEWFMALFASLHAAVGLGMTYFTICSFTNRTVIEVHRGRLTVKHTPLPWPGNHELETRQIEQLYCSEQRQKNGYIYHVMVALRGGKRLKLVSSLNDVEHALFIEQEIERHLRIADKPMSGEIAR